MHFTYVIGSGYHNVKIGHSNAARRRLLDLRTGSAVEIWLAHTWELDRPAAIKLEAALHAAFEPWVMSGEWFSILAPPVVAVGDLIVAERADDAKRLVEIIRRREAIPAEDAELRQAWRHVPGLQRRRVELEAAARRKALDAEGAALQLEAYDLGLLPDGVTNSRWLPRRLDELRQRAA